VSRLRTTTRARRAVAQGFAVAVGALFALVVGLGQPVSAAPNDGQTLTTAVPVAAVAVPPGCSSGNLCFWNGADYGDGPGELSGSNSNWRAFSHSSCRKPNNPSDRTWSDCASSIYNNGTSCTAVVWLAAGYGEGHEALARGQGVRNLSTWHVDTGPWDNNISANNWLC
jgi:peptidase inhibitor family I36